MLSPTQVVVPVMAMMVVMFPVIAIVPVARARGAGSQTKCGGTQ
jgi:hypothetical protein